VEKVCTKYKENKGVGEFSKLKSSADGLKNSILEKKQKNMQ
jgi:hypothetical protein